MVLVDMTCVVGHRNLPYKANLKIGSEQDTGTSLNITTENLNVTMDHGSEDPIPDISGQ